ncbi:hypothetical protein AB0C34_17200 [Nocardia sp. NPDC049220]|uniref:hypothetical protein n=1 Tax=Nocardia sp. NPDC049220 TaxID=3155273 RepID=UPI003406FD9A
MAHNCSVIPEHVHAGIQEAGWSGIVLPETKISDYVVYPVINVDPAVWADRVTEHQGPELDRSTLALWEAWTADLGEQPPRPALSIVGFISTANRPAAALHALDSLAGYGAGLWITSGSHGPTRWALAEFDVADMWVAHTRNAQTTVLVQGRHGPISTARRMTSTRHKEELLFQHALVNGSNRAAA